jgi:hypothetical protein
MCVRCSLWCVQVRGIIQELKTTWPGAQQQQQQ